MTDKTPQLLKGFRDFGPASMAARLDMFEKIRAAFERYGFEPMDTPALEYAAVLAGKYGADEKLMYRFRDQGEREVAMRYDLTVPLVRYYLQNRNDLPRPFKRYQIGPVWRADNPQRGRYREFYQCDVDVVGSDSTLADADCLAAVTTALTDLGVEDVAVRVNNRKILDGLFVALGMPTDKTTTLLRLIDKLDKLGEKKVKEEIERAGVAARVVRELFEYLKVSTTGAKGLQDAFGKIILESKVLAEGVGELETLLDALTTLGVKRAIVDLTLARGMDYYTGTIAELRLSELPELGSIAGGGRYDRLIGEMADGKVAVPAVGMSIGIDRLIAGLEELELVKYDQRADAIVFNLDRELTSVYLGVANELRASGIPCDLYYGDEPVEKQLKYAEKKKINLGIFIGADEIKKGTVTLKDLTTRAQWTVKAEKLAGEVAKALEK